MVDHKEIFSGVRVVDQPLSEDQMMGEVLSIILGNSRVRKWLIWPCVGILEYLTLIKGNGDVNSWPQVIHVKKD